MANITDFKSQMIGGGARPNQFRVDLSFPSFVSAGLGGIIGLNSQFLCRSAQLPASQVENIQVFYRGRPVNFAGERTFQPWTITVYNDTTFSVRNAMEAWSNGVANFVGTNGLTTPRDYQTDLRVFQLDRNGEAPIKQYTFINAYPILVGSIGLDYEQNTVIEQFDVEFMYDYFTTAEINSPSGFGVSVAVNTPIGTVAL
jgi:hypothetical protein